MKKILAILMALCLLCASLGVLAEEEHGAPLYATVGDALADAEDGRAVVGGIPGEYYAVVTEKDGKYYRNVAYWDEKLSELNLAQDSLDTDAEDFFEKFEAAAEEISAYVKTMPIAYTEVFTAEPLTKEEMAAKSGKTLAELTGEGFEIGSSGTDNDENGETYIFYDLRYGVFDYHCVMDADVEQYDLAQENDDEGSLKVKSMSLLGITEWGFDKRFHTDGTVEEQKDPFAEFSAIMTEFFEAVQNAAPGEEPDLEGVAEKLKAEHPDYADMIDLYMKMYQLYGANFASLLAPAEE